MKFLFAIIGMLMIFASMAGCVMSSNAIQETPVAIVGVGGFLMIGIVLVLAEIEDTNKKLDLTNQLLANIHSRTVEQTENSSKVVGNTAVIGQLLGARPGPPTLPVPPVE